MKHALLPALLLGTALLAGGAWSEERAQNADLETRVADLERRLSESDKLAKHLADEQATLRATDKAMLAYLERQAQAAEAMQAVLDSSEKQGFTAGINPNSRITLLAGLRSLFDSVSSDLPKAAGPAKR
ncbi:MAG: hypothetical protein GC161_12410 [Planctomycetaceae bacterium]|nr:hypothetical protein [Planctomycetaceae bacterium]